MDRIKLIYIAGTDRSGSTLLDMMIGCSPDFFSLGEIHRFHVYSVSSSGELLCSCGVTVSECSFWRAVSERLEKREDWRPELMRPLGLRKRIFINTLGRIFPGGFLTRDFCNNFAETNWMFFNAVREVSGAGYLVDSSKELVRAWILHRSGLFDVFPIYITRPVEDFIISNRSDQPGRPMGMRNSRPRTILKWFFRNLEVRSLISRIRKDYVQISYKTLATDPAGVMDSISSRYNLPISFDYGCAHAGKYHMVGGNNMKFKPFSEVRYDIKVDAPKEASPVTRLINRIFVRDNV